MDDDADVTSESSPRGVFTLYDTIKKIRIEYEYLSFSGLQFSFVMNME